MIQCILIMATPSSHLDLLWTPLKYSLPTYLSSPSFIFVTRGAGSVLPVGTLTNDPLDLARVLESPFRFILTSEILLFPLGYQQRWFWKRQ